MSDSDEESVMRRRLQRMHGSLIREDTEPRSRSHRQQMSEQQEMFSSPDFLRRSSDERESSLGYRQEVLSSSLRARHGRKKPDKAPRASTSRQQTSAPSTGIGSGEHLARRLMVAAIDFGTTYSGYAFSFKHAPTKIQMMTWYPGAHQFKSEKTPTSILLDKDLRLEAFGFEAENVYAEKCESGLQGDYYFFKHFKMTLFKNADLGRQSFVTTVDGKVAPALTVFSLAIRFMMEKLLEMAKKRQAEMTNDDIFWVLTVPAIWDDGAKQFMREAAQKAGISPDQLYLALEPEAASLYCRDLPIKREDRSETLLRAFDQQSKFMVIDAGGGTVDVTVLQVQADETFKQLYRPSGGAWGGTEVDKNFINLLKEIFGEESVEKFITENPSDYLDLMRDFEHRKREVTRKERMYSIRVPYGLREKYQQDHGEDAQMSIRNFSQKDKCGWVGDKLRLKSSLLVPLFEDVVQKIVEHIENLLEDRELAGINHVFLVGGFAQSPLLHETMTEAFPNLSITVPEDSQLSVLQGAVLFGYKPDAVSVRKSANTYGVQVIRAFLRDYDDFDKKVKIDGQDMVRNGFTTYLEKDRDVKLDEVVHEDIIEVLRASDTHMTVPVYSSAQKGVKYTDEDGCKHLGTLRVDMPDTSGGRERFAMVKMIAGGTELKVEAEDGKTKKKYKATFDFLAK